MMNLVGKKIIIGITASIAAYKSILLLRLLQNEGAEVKIILTPSANQFVTKLTLSTLSQNPIYDSFFDSNQNWINHVDLALWADFIIIAPATANTIGKMANGICDNLLLSVYLSARCPVFYAPAMDLDMYLHPTVQNNFKKLSEYGINLIDSEIGNLASGLNGKGRMAEPEHIIQFLLSYLNVKKPLLGKKVLITAGPTREAIDPVRFISNYSTGKMGYALAEEAALRGASVNLVSGPVNIILNNPTINRIDVHSAQEMFENSKKFWHDADIVIFSAAVADYTPKEISSKKIKKKTNNLSLSLIKTIDIASELGKTKTNQIVIGFALETDNELNNAKDKLQRKNLDFIVLNSLNDVGAGFGHDTNKVKIIGKNNFFKEGLLKTKKEVAKDILDCI